MKEKKIICPLCKRVIGTYDGKSTTNKVVDCRKCRKRIVYYVANGVTKVRPIPPRNCSSGITFY